MPRVRQGHGRCRDRSLPAEGEIDEFYLLPEYQGLGLGRRLFQAVRNDLRDKGMQKVAVWALEDNERALDELSQREVINTGVILAPNVRFYPVSLDRFITEILDQEFKP